jgi:GH15 family glucan-1,4-alpha-glucosidase
LTLTSTAQDRYRPIEDYALIGDCHGSALVAKDGCIDWATLHAFDADPVFCRVLDADRGGFWSLCPDEPHTATREYLYGTNMLRTVFITEAGGKVSVTDFMPVGRRLDAGLNDYVHLNAPGWIVRRVEGLAGTVRMQTRYRPSKQFASESVQLTAGENGAPGIWAGLEMPGFFCADLPCEFPEADVASAVFDMLPGLRHDLILAGSTVAAEHPGERADTFYDATKAFWEEWISYCRYRGDHLSEVHRGALTLKMLTFAPTGAIVAAPTTSLPESIGGERNWDYRYCWVRDSCFALYALAVLGYGGEARCFHEFLARAIDRSLPEVQPMYGIDGNLRLPEAELGHLEGYRASAPVRTGNGAYLQRQIDAYGQMLDLSLLFRTLGGKLDPQYKRLLGAVAQFIKLHWREPDQGIWEVRGPARDYVHSKLMSWVGLDRAARLLGGDWAQEALRAADNIRAHAVVPQTPRAAASALMPNDVQPSDAEAVRQRDLPGALRQAYDGGADAAVLLAPMLAFDFADATLKATIQTVKDRLGHNGFVCRYAGADGLSGSEGSFLVCSSWLIDAQLAAGQLDDARAGLKHLLAWGNDVGLFSEEVEASSGAMLGNFPQALTHLGVIGNIVNLQLAEKHGAKALHGSYADRARLAVDATFGWRGVLAAMWQLRRFGRFRSSKNSKLAWP